VESWSFWQSYIFAWTFWTSLTVGCIGLMLMQNIVRAVWGYPVVRMCEAGAKLLPLMFVLYLILFAFGRSELYPWAQPALVAKDPVLQYKMRFMSGWQVMLRVFLIMVFWGILILINLRSSRRQDETGDENEARLRTNVSSPGLVFFILTLTFVFTDTVMSLEPHWYSTIYGLLFMADSGLVGFSFVTILLMLFRNREPYRGVVNRVVMRDLGNLLLTFTMVWAYFNISQFLIQWSGNLPEEVSYYFVRDNDPWRWLGILTMIGQFFLPFLLLLSNRAKREPQKLLAVAALIFIVRAADIYWIIIPTFRTQGPGLGGLVDLGIWLVMGAIWLAGFFALLKTRPLLPRYITESQMEALEHA